MRERSVGLKTVDIADRIHDVMDSIALVQAALPAIADSSAHGRASDAADAVLEAAITTLGALAGEIHVEGAAQ
ncbi:hypothetical protein [Terrihabitans rhizophilus]|uniref:Uncharacterized protein n=1 Tax=Terrihabitans rhizophilus TaxID=3092662 RepID=A0ABU4RNE0_9HYPH|nr:hypothetical protein [Terrihabitans sp. PJ23]MDX6806342.1 hypothetical protein [Terrihabitans sp. PJ23]